MSPDSKFSYIFGDILPVQWLISGVFQPLQTWLDKHWTVRKVMPLLLLFVTVMFAVLYFLLEWILWKRMLLDVLLPLSFLFYCAVLSPIIADVCEYSAYERQNLQTDINYVGKDVYLSIWKDTKYYSFLQRKRLTGCDFGDDTLIFFKAFKKYWPLNGQGSVSASASGAAVSASTSGAAVSASTSGAAVSASTSGAAVSASTRVAAVSASTSGGSGILRRR